MKHYTNDRSLDDTLQILGFACYGAYLPSSANVVPTQCACPRYHTMRCLADVPAELVCGAPKQILSAQLEHSVFCFQSLQFLPATSLNPRLFLTLRIGTIQENSY